MAEIEKKDLETVFNEILQEGIDKNNNIEEKVVRDLYEEIFNEIFNQIQTANVDDNEIAEQLNTNESREMIHQFAIRKHNENNNQFNIIDLVNKPKVNKGSVSGNNRSPKVDTRSIDADYLKDFINYHRNNLMGYPQKKTYVRKTYARKKKRSQGGKKNTTKKKRKLRKKKHTRRKKRKTRRN